MMTTASKMKQSQTRWVRLRLRLRLQLLHHSSLFRLPSSVLQLESA
jgi:hypothetical protein